MATKKTIEVSAFTLAHRAFMNEHEGEYTLADLQMIERDVKVLKKPFMDAVCDMVKAKFAVAETLDVLRTTPKLAAVRMQTMPKEALLIMTRELGIKGVSSYNKKDVLASIVAGKAIHAKPPESMPLMQAASA